MGTELNLETLLTVMPHCPVVRAGAYLPFIKAAMAEAEVNTPERIAMFLAQIAVETGELRWLEEIWGPTSAQLGYEGRKDLGNNQPGDGKRYRGRGALQVTGRFNYRAAGHALGVDLENNPDEASAPENAFRVAAWFWKTRRLNETSDQRDVEAATKKINGGSNGLEQRRSALLRAFSLLH